MTFSLYKMLGTTFLPDQPTKKELEEHYHFQNSQQSKFILKQIIHCDIANNKLVGIKYLFENNFNLLDPELELLHAAARLGRIEILKYLISLGSDLDTLDKYGCSPLIAALKHGQLEASRILLNEGANPNIKSLDDGKSALHYAVAADDTEITAQLLARGADVNATTKTNNTPLHISAENATKEMTKILFANKANPFIKNDEGNTALNLAGKNVHHHFDMKSKASFLNSLQTKNLIVETPFKPLVTQQRNIAAFSNSLHSTWKPAQSSALSTSNIIKGAETLLRRFVR